jgi:hypothetical protein
MCRALALFTLLLCFPSSASAVLIRVDFFVRGDTDGGLIDLDTGEVFYGVGDPLNTDEIVHGFFTFDSALLPRPDDPFENTFWGGLGATRLRFEWQGVSYKEQGEGPPEGGTGDIWYLRVDADGNLADWALYGNSSYGAEIGLSNGYDDFLIRSGYDEDAFWYSNEYYVLHPDLVWKGDLVRWSYREIPEPGTLALFAPGLLALGVIRRRKHYAPNH